MLRLLMSAVAIFVGFFLVGGIGQDDTERQRLRIFVPPDRLPCKVIRAPLPWHQAFLSASEAMEDRLFVTSPTHRAALQVSSISVPPFCRSTSYP